MKNIFALLLFIFSYTAAAQIVINELDSDTPSTDDREFIELKSTTPNFPLDGYVLVFFNGNPGSTTANQSYYALDLDGLTTDANGIILIGSSLVSPAPDKLFPDNIIQNGADGVGIYLGNASDFPEFTLATTTNLIDALMYDTNDADATALMNLLGVTAQYNEGQNSLQTTQSVQRKNDGTYETKNPTPGANNDGSGIIFNGITITANTADKKEGDNFAITFTTQTNVNSDLTLNFTLNNSAFTTADFTGSTTVFIPEGSNTFTTTITLTDDLFDEGDEILKIKFSTIPSQYKRLNDNIEIRVIDNDFSVAPFGTPLNPTHEIVSSTAPTDYYATLEGLSGAALKQAIQDIIANPAVVHAHNYGDIIEILKTADQNPLNSNEVWLMYVEESRSKLEFQDTGINTGKWNREHIYPQSRGGYTDGTESIPDGINIWLSTNANDILAGHADAHHLRAEDGAQNSLRSNKDYGLTGYNGPSGTMGSWKGDVARSVFYMAVRYNALSVVNGDIADTTVGQLGDLASLLTWNTLDPSDDFEMNRNNYIYTWQINRNPFVDYPELANYIWGSKVGQVWYSNLSTNDFVDLKVNLYPNPAKKSITISGVNEKATIEIYNTIGAKVFSQKFIGETKMNIDFPSGIYFAKINSGQQSIVKKFLVE
ncbi:T9SS type A sorting domain-containing protein [Flavobacterium franklandianum]|uniref:T9SS type A sorting domain-containing protein n=1 Tax=Flavobacterium franklandianum TaxID=2594430 RepID=A0A553CTH6_9FLAO|nr:endonuclease [Flavobacterium franklandianum]TRX23819.1 T9SS type A sorting domain-containing protein [Flavobacterium franklandianum]TRX27903.1 T9SS type A sorting domain-containing protein [Flavobacterium franklandianum]